MSTFFRSHRINNSLNALECIVVDINILNGFSYTRNHGSQFLQITHLLNLVNLSQEIIEIKLVFLNFLLEAFRFFFIILFLCTFYQRYDITHTQDTVSHTSRVELIYGIQFLTGTHEHNRLVYYRTDRQGRTTTCITIQLGQYDTGEIQTFIKFTSCIYRILSGHGIYHKQCSIRIDSFLDGFNLVHHLLVYCQTTSRIDNYQVIPFCFRFLNGIQGNLYRIFTVQFAIYRNFYLLAEHFQLLNCSRTIHVTRYQQRFTVLL